MTGASSVEPLAYRPEKALEIFPIGRTVLFDKLRSGEIASFRVGRSRFIPRQALIDFMSRQLAEQADD